MFSEIFKKHALFYILFLQRKDCFKKEKKPIRILHVKDNLKINVCLLQAVQCIFSFLLKRVIFFSNNVASACCMLVFLPGDKTGESTVQGTNHAQWIIICLANNGK